ncbi:MAG: carbohydrate-binding domain-containing protein [Clostridia bacterium]|nr:carbohydrate-binding domain-containing protein [Clostridia bacterium]
MKKYLALILALLFTLSAVPALGEEAAAGPDINDYFSKRDLSGQWDAGDAQYIELAESLTITEAGTYVLSGSMAGCVTVSAPDDAKVQLVLRGVDISVPSGAAILVENADKVFVTLETGTVNTLSSEAFDENDPVDGVIFSHDDLTLNGKGTLKIESAGHGIVGKDDLKICGGTYILNVEGRGLCGNDSVRVADGDIAITSGKDGVRAKNEEDETKGYVIVFGGKIAIVAGGGAANGETHTDDFGGSGGSGGGWNDRVSADSASSTKGIKATGTLTIVDGEISIDSADDALHSNTDVTVLGGALTLSSGDDGMHADKDLLISGGTVRVTKSYEGLEGMTITVAGGDIAVWASDDGLNAAGGSDASGFGRNDMFAVQAGVCITISGGTLYVNSSGDGVDSNGNLVVTGGQTVVSGPVSSMNGALDKNGTATISGGTMLAAGTTSMAESFGSGSTQCFALVRLNGSAGTILVKDSGGNVVLSGDVEKSFGCVVVSCPELVKGEKYTVSCGTASVAFTASGSAAQQTQQQQQPQQQQQQTQQNGGDPSNGGQGQQPEGGFEDSNGGQQNQQPGGDFGGSDGSGGGPGGGQ